MAQFLAPFSKRLDFAYFLVTNLHLLAFIILGFLLIALMATIFPKLTHENGSSRPKSLKTILFHTLFIDYNQLPRVHLRLLFLSFSLFLLLNLNFLSNSIKTDKVLVPTDEIVDSISKLIKTPKTLAMDANTLSRFKTAPDGSSFKQLSKKDVITVNSLKDLNQMKSTGLHRHVIFSSHTELVYLMSLVSEHARDNGLIAFHKSTDYFETLIAFLMRRNFDEKRKRFINHKSARLSKLINDQ